jgi:hypothetical protein
MEAKSDGDNVSSCVTVWEIGRKRKKLTEFFVWFMLNFAVAESDLHYLNNFRSTEEWNSRFGVAPRSSQQTTFRHQRGRRRLYHGLGFEITGERGARGIIRGQRDEMSVSAVKIMKDYSTVGENKTLESTFISEAEDSGKLRWEFRFNLETELKFSFFSSHNIRKEYLEKMAEVENKMKKEAEMREEQLLKRVSEKDKQIAKMKWDLMWKLCKKKF